MSLNGLASHHVDRRSVETVLREVRRAVAELDLLEVERAIGFCFDEVLDFYHRELGARFPLSGADARALLLHLAEAAAESDVGAFLLCAQGCDWRTTDLFFDEQHRDALRARLTRGTLGLFDYLLFFAFPGWLATQERFGIFQRLTQPHVRDGAVLASLPCGRMRDLLTLTYTAVQRPVLLIGIDKDPAALVGARALAATLSGLAGRTWQDYRLGDAFRPGLTHPPIDEALDLLTSNGLNIYLTEQECAVFYEHVFHALKPGGVFITSHLVPSTEYQWERMTRGYWQLQALAWTILIKPKWNALLKPAALVATQLARAGFVDVQIARDSRGVYPTFMARKPA